MRKKLTIFAVLMLLILLPILAIADDYAVVTNGRLNLRQYPSSSSASLGQYSSGSWIRIVGQPNNGWYPVTTMDGRSGYMYGSYLTFASSGNVGTVRYAQGGYVNLRSGPSMDYPIIAQVTTGTSVSILNTTYDWCYVSLYIYGTNYQGYMLSSLINRASDTSVVTTRNGGKVNVRSGPSFNYGSIGSLSSGTTVTVLLKGKDWYWVSGGGITGFMSTSYLSGSGGGGGGSTSTTAYVNNPKSTQVLNLRASPSQSSRSLGQYRNGTMVKVVSRGNTWSEVYVGTKHGYMMTRYLSFNGTYLPATTVVPSTYGQADPYAYTYSQPIVNVPDQQAYVQQPVATVVPIITATPMPVYQQPVVTATPMPIYQQPVATAVPTFTPAPYAQTQQASTASSVKNITLVSSTGTVNFYEDKLLTSPHSKGNLASGSTGKLLSSSDTFCLVLVNNNVGYVSPQNVVVDN